MSIYDLTVYRGKTLAKWAELWFSMNNDAVRTKGLENT